MEIYEITDNLLKRVIEKLEDNELITELQNLNYTTETDKNINS